MRQIGLIALTGLDGSYYDESVRHLNIRTGEHIGISPPTKKQVKPREQLCSRSFTILQPFSILWWF